MPNTRKGKQVARRERVAAIRAQQQRAERRRNLMTLGAIIAAVAVIIGAVAWYVASRSSGATAEAIPPGGRRDPARPARRTRGAEHVRHRRSRRLRHRRLPAASRNGPAARALPHRHVSGPVQYSVTPPVGGDHNATWMNCGIYTQPVPRERAVHNLEHGAVWITYQPSLPQSEVSQLRAFVGKQAKVSPGGTLPPATWT